MNHCEPDVQSRLTLSLNAGHVREQLTVLDWWEMGEKRTISVHTGGLCRAMVEFAILARERLPLLTKSQPDYMLVDAFASGIFLF